MSSMGLGMVADQLADLKLGELLDTPPPGLDEAVAIAKVNPLLSTLQKHLMSCSAATGWRGR
jgi:arsenite-transporting ATPase